MTTLIELSGGPGSGKTTTALGLCNLLKYYFSEFLQSNISVEYVSEFAKEIAYEYQDIVVPYHHKIKNQALLFGTQLERLLQLKQKTDFIVSDSALFLCAEYAPKEFYDEQSFVNLILSNYKHFDKVVHIFVERDLSVAFSNKGRFENLERAVDIDKNIRHLLGKYSFSYLTFRGNISAPIQIINYLSGHNILPMKEDCDFVNWYKIKIIESFCEI